MILRQNVAKQLCEIDKKLLLLINQRHSPLMDDLMWFASERLSKLSLQLIVFALLAVIFRKRSPGLLIALIVLLMLASQLLVLLAKYFFKRRRPFVNNPRVRTIKDYKLTDASFFSAHTANAFVPVVLVATIIKSRIIKLFLYSAGAVVGYSRLYLGQHYPSDVLVGFCAGTLFGKIGAKIYRLSRRGEKVVKR